MHHSLQPYETLVDQKYIRKQETEDLVQYTYTEKAEYDRYWNEYTRKARGIIFEKATGKLIAKPFEKFFNYGTTEETFVQNLPQESYKVYEKLDGSLGIIYYWDGFWQVATKGSFQSDQALKAQEMLSKYNTGSIPYTVTLLTEIIYPENKIVVNYGQEKKLVLLAAYDVNTEKELDSDSLHWLSKLTKLPLANVYNYTIDKMIELQKTIPKDQEGFVVRFENGFRVKIKGEEYCKIHKIISNLSPLSLWEVMNNNGIVNPEYLQQVPEEYRFEIDPLVNKLETLYKTVYNEIIEDIKQLPSQTNKREIGMFLEKNKLKHNMGIFPYILNNKESLHKYIMKTIRPTGNNFV